MMTQEETMNYALTTKSRVRCGRQGRGAFLALLAVAGLLLLSSCQRRQESNALDDAYQALVAGASFSVSSNRPRWSTPRRRR